MVAPPRQQGADARLLPRRGCPGPPLLAVSPWALRRKARSALVYPRAVRMSECPAPPPAFAELVAATNYSFLRGASHPAEMVAEAMALGLAGIGIADRNSVAGVVRAGAYLKELQVTGEASSGFTLADVAPTSFADASPLIVTLPVTCLLRGWLTPMTAPARSR